MTAPSPPALQTLVEIDGVTVPAGDCVITGRAAKPVLRFTYTQGYLALPTGYDLDPALRRDRSTHIGDGVFGAFADCAPDWWGRNLITRRLRAQAREAGQPPPLITDIDFLTGVSDTTRQGALRFRRPGEDGYLAADIDVPALIELPTLLQASDDVAGDTTDDDQQQAVKTLLDAGSGTLGGARPKAAVRDGDTLYIAKFPHPREDQWDVMAWEKTALDLAELAGLAVPARRLERVDGRNVLLVARFDRQPRPDGGLNRIGYVSASTLVGGERSAPRDYLDISAAIEDYSAAATDDLIDMWRRMAFSVAIHNTDDHLRNHGFLRAPGGWRLSPVFDINPNPELAVSRSTSINGATLRQDELSGLTSAAPWFGLSKAGAAALLSDILAVTARWAEVAAGNGISDGELARFAPVFRDLPGSDR